MIPIEYGKYFHIYNRGINGMKIFLDNNDYEHFLNLLSIYIEPISEIYAYAIMGNHFHLAIRIKYKNEIGYLHPKNADTEELDLKWKTFFPTDDDDRLKNGFIKKPVPEKMFQHLFNAYAKGFNKKYHRTGSLFEHPFRRICVDNKNYLKLLIVYIHTNPVKHGFCEYPVEYPWTSYLSLLSIKPTKLSRETVIGWFDDKMKFKLLHDKTDDFTDIEDIFLE